ncbi:MAG: hypothetical protein KJ626_16890 [Verrucomicrobia bacterium]|nr:hypothetical protein [Verrucomicrobiota bacterium]
MSAAPRMKGNWIKDNYEKLALVLGLILLLVSAVFLVSQISLEKRELAEARWQQPLHGLVKADSLEISVYDSYQEELKNPFQAATATNHAMVSELRVSCINPACRKPIPYHAESCPFCGTEQPKIREADRDGDGLLDDFEIAHGLDPYNSEDAEADLDGDDFTNLEEYQSGTNPSDPKSFPPPVAKLRLARIVTKPFKLRFQGVSELSGSARYQLNMRSLERTYFARMDEVVEGFTVVKFDSRTATNTAGRVIDQSVLTLEQGGKHIELVKGRVLNESELIAYLISIIGQGRFTVRLDSEFTLKGETYKVVDIKPDAVLIENTGSGLKTSVPRLTDAEKSKILGRDESQSMLGLDPGVRGGGYQGSMPSDAR